MYSEADTFSFCTSAPEQAPWDQHPAVVGACVHSGGRAVFARARLGATGAGGHHMCHFRDAYHSGGALPVRPGAEQSILCAHAFGGPGVSLACAVSSTDGVPGRCPPFLSPGIGWSRSSHRDKQLVSVYVYVNVWLYAHNVRVRVSCAHAAYVRVHVRVHHVHFYVHVHVHVYVAACASILLYLICSFCCFVL